MKVIIVGAAGTLGQAIGKAVSEAHEVIRVGATSGDLQCDYTSSESVKALFQSVGPFDALVAVAGGDSIFKNVDALVDDDYRYGFERKFLGQVRLLQHGLAEIRDNGSFTLTSGYLSHYPNPASIATGPLNAAIDTYVQNIAILMPRGVRVNVVSPAPVVEDGSDGLGLVTADQCADCYMEAIEGNMTGNVFRVWGGLAVSG